MPYTMEDFMHDVALEHISSLTTDELLQNLFTDDRLEDLSLNKILKHFSSEEIQAQLEQIKSNKPDSDKG